MVVKRARSTYTGEKTMRMSCHHSINTGLLSLLVLIGCNDRRDDSDSSLSSLTAQTPASEIAPPTNQSNLENCSNASVAAIEPQSDESMLIHFSGGRPGCVYRIQAIDDIGSTAWDTLDVRTADNGGQFSYLDIAAANHGSRYYQSRSLWSFTFTPAFQIDDYDVSSDGSLIAVGELRNPVYGAAGVDSAFIGQCLDANHHILKDAFLIYDNQIDETRLDGQTIRVARSRTTGVSAVLASVLQTPGTLGSEKWMVKTYDANCNPLDSVYFTMTSGEAHWNGPAGATIVAADNGTFTVGTPTGIRIYSSNLSSIRFLPFSCDGYANMALNKKTGDGVAVCTPRSYNVEDYRRFSAAGTWTDAGWVNIPGSGLLLDDQWTSVGMNEADEFVILWSGMSFYDVESFYRASFFGSDGSLKAQTSLQSHYGVKIPNVNGDFIVPWSSDGSESDVYTRFSSAGAAVASGGLDRYDRSYVLGQLLLSGDGSTYLLDSGGSIRENAITIAKP